MSTHDRNPCHRPEPLQPEDIADSMEYTVTRLRRSSIAASSSAAS